MPRAIDECAALLAKTFAPLRCEMFHRAGGIGFRVFAADKSCSWRTGAMLPRDFLSRPCLQLQADNGRQMLQRRGYLLAGSPGRSSCSRLGT